MNKIAKVIIAIQTVLIVFFIVFANIKANEAEVQVQKAQGIAEKSRTEAERYQMHAERLAADAHEAQLEAELIMKKLMECQNKNQ